MLIVVTMRWSPPATVHPLTGHVGMTALGGGPSESDRCALEYALRLAELHDGRCVVVSQGPPETDEMLRETWACGADSVLRVDAETDPRLPDSGRETARSLAAAIRSTFGIPSLIVAGQRSTDRATGSTTAFLAAEFGFAQALGLIELSSVDGSLEGVRRLDHGRRERLRIPFPAVCSVEPAGVRLRRASLPAMLATKDRSIPTTAVTGGERITVRSVTPYRPRPKEIPAPSGTDPLARAHALTTSPTGQRREPPRIVTGDPADAADELIAFLHAKGYLSRHHDPAGTGDDDE